MITLILAIGVNSICLFADVKFIADNSLNNHDLKEYPLYFVWDEINYKELLKLADIIIPNYTESLLLCGYRANDDVGYDVIADKLKMLAKSFVITSYVENNEHFVIVYDHILDKLDKIAYEYLPYSLAGTGDIFASILISNYLNGYDLYTSSIKTIRSINILIKANMHLKQGKPLAIEQYLDKIF